MTTQRLRFSRSYATGLIVLWLGIADGATASTCKPDCAGDCSGDGAVTVDELANMIEFTLGVNTHGCSSGDVDQNGAVTVDEILTAVNNALVGCPPPVTTECGNGITDECRGEECDDGGMCAGGEDAGKACHGEADCSGQVGACIGGRNNLHACQGGQDCPGGECRRCRPVGGDGCAQNCTLESDLPFPFEVDPVDDGKLGDGSGFIVQGPQLIAPIRFIGSESLTTGRPRGDQLIPVVVKATSINIAAAPVETIACMCASGVELRTCGGVLVDEFGAAARPCTPELGGQPRCPVDRPCAPVHGPGNAASGFVDCSSAPQEYDVSLFQDCLNAPLLAPETTVDERRTGPGAALITQRMTLRTVVGLCHGAAPDYGPDGTFCSDDDPWSTYNLLTTLQMTTGTATASMYPNYFTLEAEEPISRAADGTGFPCRSGAVNGTAGAALVSATVHCDERPGYEFIAVGRLKSAALPEE